MHSQIQIFTLFYCCVVHFLPKASKFILPFILAYFNYFNMECYISLEYNTFISFFSQECYFSFSLRHHLSSHAHTWGIFSLTQALTPIFPFPLPNHVYLPVATSALSNTQPSSVAPVSPGLSPDYCSLCTIPSSQSVNQLQYIHLSTAFVCLVRAVLRLKISSVHSCWKVWGWTWGNERSLFLAHLKALQ